MSSAVATEPRPRSITHIRDKPMLGSMGADLTDPELIAEYFEYRDAYNKPGELPMGVLLELRVRQKRRKAQPSAAVPKKGNKP